MLSKYEAILFQKPHILTQFDENYRLINDFTLFLEKNWPSFWIMIPPSVKKGKKPFFL